MVSRPLEDAQEIVVVISEYCAAWQETHFFQQPQLLEDLHCPFHGRRTSRCLPKRQSSRSASNSGCPPADLHTVPLASRADWTACWRRCLFEATHWVPRRHYPRYPEDGGT